MKELFVVLLGVLLFTGCNRRIESKGELLNYISDIPNGLKHEKGLNNGIEVSMTYTPDILLKLPVTDTSKRFCYFSLRLSRNHQQLIRQYDNYTYSQVLQTLSFRMLDYTKALDEHKKSILPIGSFYQQTFGMTNYDELLLVFDYDKLLNTDRIKICIEEFGLNLGRLVFDFKTKDMLTLNSKIKHML